MSSAVRLGLGFFYMAVMAVVAMVLAVPLLPFRILRIKLCNYYGKCVGPVLIWLARATPVVQHRERIAATFPAIYVSNHTSTLDAFIAIWLCPVGGCGVGVLVVPFGILICCPTKIWLGFLICGFAARMACTVVSCRLAIAASVSPDLTT